MTIHPSHSISDTQLKSICSHTTSVSFCIRVLKSDPRAASADLPGLLGIAVDLSHSKAYAGLSLVQSLERKAADPVLKGRLQACSEYYALGRSLLSRAKQSLRLKEYGKVGEMAGSVMGKHEDCEDQFEPRNLVAPDQLRQMNEDMEHLCNIVFTVSGQPFGLK